MREFRRAVELNPQDTQAGAAGSPVFKLQMGARPPPRGPAEARRAFDEDPLLAYAASLVGVAYACFGQTAEGRARRIGAQRDPRVLS